MSQSENPCGVTPTGGLLLISDSAPPQPQVAPGPPGQVVPLSQGQQEKADQEIFIVILPGRQEPQERIKREEPDATARQQTAKPGSSSLTKPKTRMAAKRGHTASTSVKGGGSGVKLGATVVGGGSGVNPGTAVIGGGSGVNSGTAVIGGGIGVNPGTAVVGGGSGVNLGAVKENVGYAQCRHLHASLTRPPEGKKALQTLQAVSTRVGACVVTSRPQKPMAEQSLQAVLQNLDGPGLETAIARESKPTRQQVCVSTVNLSAIKENVTDAQCRLVDVSWSGQSEVKRTLHTLQAGSTQVGAKSPQAVLQNFGGPTLETVCVSTVNTPSSASSTLSTLSTPHSQGFLSPMAASTPLNVTPLANRPAATGSCRQDSHALPHDPFICERWVWSDVGTSQSSAVTASSTYCASVSTQNSVSKGQAAALSKTTQLDLTALRGSPVSSQELLFGTLFADKPSTSSQLSALSQSSAERRPFSGVELLHEETQDSGIGVSMAHASAGAESDYGATCSSWAASEDSNQMVIDFNVDSLSQGSMEDNSNSQGIIYHKL